MITCPPSSARPSVGRLSTPLNVFSSETLWPSFFKLYVAPSVTGGLKICRNGHGPFTGGKVSVVQKDLSLKGFLSVFPGIFYTASLHLNGVLNS